MANFISDEELDKQIEEAIGFVNEKHERLKNEEIINNLIDNSIPKEGKGKRRVIVNWKNATKAVAIVGGITVVIVNIASLISAKIEKQKAFNNVVNKSEIISEVKDAETNYWEFDPSSPEGAEKNNKYHDTYKIGEHLVLESEDFHTDLRIVAEEITKKYDAETEEKVMDSILQQVSNINDEENPNHILDYASWEDYCIKHGFVDKDGNADFSKYMEEMKEHVSSEEINDDFENEHGLRSFR